MGRAFLAAAVLFLAVPTTCLAQRQAESVNRGLVAIRTSERQVFLSWRLLGRDVVATDHERIAFHLYRTQGNGPGVRINDQPIMGATNFVDTDEQRGAAPKYFVRPVLDGADQSKSELADSERAAVWDAGHLEIPIKPIEGYRPGDASVGDLDGDGQYEIVLHQTSRGRDNSFAGVTGEPIFDAYKLDGTHLWRINLGKNIREGEHYTQFMVYDLDGDGRAEIACKTADGTIDGIGKAIGDSSKDWRTDDPDSTTHGRILAGPEYFTIFDGRTGAALKTVDYIPSREPIDGWGGIGGNAGNDNYGNRCDRFLACIAYLDGERPSVVMCRGVYGRTVLAAWDWRDGNLTSRWVFDTGVSRPPYTDASKFSGMGGHTISVADVDADGRDEIVYQAMVVDDDGKGLYSTGLRHGDSLHVADMDPDRPGLEVFTVQENEERAEQFQSPGAALRDARTGEILWSHSPAVDVGAGMAADIDPTHRGYEVWGGPGGLRNAKGEQIGPAPRETGWCIWWDGDLLRELFTGGRRDGALVSKWNWQSKQEEPLQRFDARPAGRGPVLVADLLGDWREEVLLVSPDGKSLRLYSTTISTEHRLITLMHDPHYRLGIAWQNVAYNKPCHPSFYLGDGMATPPRPKLRIVGQREQASKQ